MARITLFPYDGTATIDGNYAPGVNYTGIDPTIHCVQWYDTYGWVEYVGDLVTGIKPPNVNIDTISPYQAYIDSADIIINAYLNPIIAYSTSDSTIFEGQTYFLGDEIVISTPDTLPPTSSTNEAPPTPEDFQELWWYSSASTWVASPFNPTLTLSQAKSTLTALVNTSAAEQGDLQARVYSTYQLLAAADAGSLATADYFGVDLATYQTYLDGQVATMEAMINAATTNAQLYSFDWRIEGDPNA
jgi:hypothetical protein